MRMATHASWSHKIQSQLSACHASAQATTILMVEIWTERKRLTEKKSKNAWSQRIVALWLKVKFGEWWMRWLEIRARVCLCSQIRPKAKSLPTESKVLVRRETLLKSRLTRCMKSGRMREKSTLQRSWDWDSLCCAQKLKISPQIPKCEAEKKVENITGKGVKFDESQSKSWFLPEDPSPKKISCSYKQIYSTFRS